MSETQLRAFERSVLGPGHAAEHARLRRAERTGELAGKGVNSAEGQSAFRAAAALAGPPEQVGRWGAPFSIPVMGIHAAMLPTGKVMWFSYPKNPAPRHGGGGVNDPNTAQAWLWDPATGTTKRVDPPLWRDPGDGQLKPANIWCAGQTFTADGRLVVFGGNLRFSEGTVDFKGLNKVYTFNPFNETWTEQPDMRHGRWYPTGVRMSDGRIVIINGLDESGAGFKRDADVELFTPSADMNGRGTVSLLGTLGGAGQPPIGGLYPHMFAMPSGRTMVAGPFPEDTWFLNPPGPSNSYTWQDYPNVPTDRLWGTAVLMPGGTGGSTQVMQLGGSTTSTSTSVATTDVFDEANPALGWRAAPSMQVGRGHHNTVLLPDGSMVTVGGGVGIRNGDQWAGDPEQRQVELWNPATGTWALGPSQAETRAYHSTALLLPDGRVVSAGDDVNGGTDRDTAEIYEPPYLFKGARPTISSAPTSAQIGTTFNVDTPDTNITKATLVAPGATTHANDMNQRYIPLTVAQRAGGVTLTAPASAELATPGYYMLFLLNAQGVPSVAKFISLTAAAAPPGGLIEKATGRAAQASSMYSATYAPGKAVDGSSTTRWSSNFTDAQWWQVDLGSVRKVSKVELNWEAAYASQYKIQTSTDGTTFTDAAVVSNTGAGLKSTTFADRDARYVRVLGVTRATQYGISFWDARVYGPSDTAPPPPPPAAPATAHH